MSNALNDIVAERCRHTKTQIGGVPTDEFDKGNSQNDWVGYINSYTGRAADKVARNVREGHKFRDNMVKAAALAIAAVEAYDKGYCPNSPGFER